MVVIYLIYVRSEVYCLFRFSRKEGFDSINNYDIITDINLLIQLLTYLALLDNWRPMSYSPCDHRVALVASKTQYSLSFPYA